MRNGDSVKLGKGTEKNGIPVNCGQRTNGDDVGNSPNEISPLRRGFAAQEIKN